MKIEDMTLLDIDWKYRFKYLVRHTGSGIYGFSYLFTFPNGHSASVVKNNMSMGGKHDLWEVGHVLINEYGGYDFQYDLFEDGVVGYLTSEKVFKVLEQIRNY